MLPSDIVFVLDSSLSVGFSDFRQMLTFVKNVAGYLRIGPDESQVGVIKYSSSVRREFLLNMHHSKQEVLDAIERIDFASGKTYTAEALKHANSLFREQNGGRDGVIRIVVLLTDGESTEGPEVVIAEAEKLKSETGATVITIGVGNDLSHLELLGIASNPNEFFYHEIDSFDSLETIEATLAMLLCAPPAVETTSTSTTQPSSNYYIILCYSLLLYYDTYIIYFYVFNRLPIHGTH